MLLIASVVAGVVVVVIVTLVVLKYLPVKYTTLIEGVFDRKEDSSDFYKEVIAFWFDNECRECFEKNPGGKVLYNQCHTSVPAGAVNLNPEIEPQNGDSIKIIARQTIFGRIVAYELIRTNFAEEFAVRQLQKEVSENEAYQDAYDRREAMRRRLSLEEYRQAKKNEKIQYAAERLKLSREEVIEHEYDKLPQFTLSIVRKLIKELGRKPTKDEMSAELKRNREEMAESARSIPVKDHDGMCAEYMFGNPDLHQEYIATGTSSNQEFTEHLAECQDCLSQLTEARERFLKSAGPDCLTADERGAIRTSGLEPKNRKDHIARCFHCYIVFSQCKEKHLSGQPGSECFTKDNLHTVHSVGEIPEMREAHLENCLRCQIQTSEHRNAYIDKIIPPPKLPKIRLKSIRTKYKNQTTV
ncbi:MAG: hypothetical protein A2745_02885 [Candidatus Harrisonbacteria bacterium RIFCSPHIGHO2_01_FULL_44_13]|uniref:Uncharacterized protein n=1 Tax=Candidatus Harrisonbacteria bacterium RIFCSPLOWO2_01_FULL_44_18 TaxID=1798407 RepID=A0A1G1ZN08_9BACT|nr:MAG: hypothetical protein A2745_02885 [Candidatus Harrisonbacteria bacterium RIFCSPHIGHO2_01_FULL_44_13]OGY65526.1 MAG: hypothetical protein A3A16_01515 [Candidatus Harrisonbacteria bacterium RIFCSPLOWO2_01_FULL_44_18]